MSWLGSLEKGVLKPTVLKEDCLDLREESVHKFIN